ncbi:MAG: ARMT1-like domain-containing protein [Thermodesulfobacteriota bacterium]|nr:ARMT1-like domain-containing protein [Thermodesulfobacteriota bacterium]
MADFTGAAVDGLGLHDPGEYVKVQNIMRTYLDCMPCFIQQTLDAARMAGGDDLLQARVLKHILLKINEMDISQPPPLMGRTIHRTIREMVKDGDPYKQVKDRFNQFALELYPALKQQVASAGNRLETAARIAIAGNIIDFGVQGDVSPQAVMTTIDEALAKPVFGDMAMFSRAVADAGTILYLADNAGEIVFDRLLVEALPEDRVTLAVRGAPVINDATIDDARTAGLDQLVPVIDNGTDIPGTVLSECSEPFVNTFKSADMIISKGQGNYETLSETTDHNNIFFLFKTKCPVAARDVGCEQGRFVLTRLAGK